jgi:hypothetical protein
MTPWPASISSNHAVRLVGCALACIVPFIAGCGGRHPIEPQNAKIIQGGLEVQADWNDVIPSVLLAVSWVEMAVVRGPDAKAIDTATEQQFELLTAGDEPAVLTARRASLTSGSSPIAIRLDARVGRFGNPDAEHRLLSAVARRLEQLAGIEVAPAR